MANIIKTFIKKIPYEYIPTRFLRKKYNHFILKNKSTIDVFSEIYKTNAWGGDPDTRSGAGSNLEETKKISEELPKLIEKYNISSVLDIPCGDFYWMKHVELGSVQYTGADIVSEIIEQNKKHEKNNIRFEQLNLIEDVLPAVDLVLVRDCLVHLSYNDIFKSLANICKSGSKYLLTTTFTDRTKNKDIATGLWRTLNFQAAPFKFPEPIRIIREECQLGDGGYKDKALGLWKIEDIKNSL